MHIGYFNVKNIFDKFGHRLKTAL